MRYVILIAMGLLGCGSGVEPADPSYFEGNTGAETTPPPSPGVEENVAEQPDPLAGLSPEEQWEWAVSVYPALAETRQPLTPPSFEGWQAADGTVTLYTRSLHLVTSDRRPSNTCVRGVFEVLDGELETRVPSSNAEPRPDLTEGFTLLTLGEQAVTNAHEVQYEGEQDDEEAGIGASAGWPTRLGALTEATEDMLRYGASAQNMAAVCATRTITRHCQGGETQSCQVCDLVLRPVPDPGGAPSGDASVEMESDCGPCPPDDAAAHLAAINRVIADRVFAAMPEEAGAAQSTALTFFRTQAACRRYRGP